VSQVDVIALSRAEKEVAEDLVALQAAYGPVPPDDEYWATVLAISHKLFEVGGVEEGFRVLAIVPPAYFRGPLVEQMEVDPELAAKAKLVADKLMDAGRAKLPRYIVDTSKHIVQRKFGRA
jgi:hypothetical protein